MPARRLPDAELDVLACVRRRTAATAREVREDLAASRPMAHGSVLTLLGRLEGRGLVARSPGASGKAFVYRPTARAAKAFEPMIKRVLYRLFHDNPVSVVASLFDARPMTPAELDEMSRLIERARHRQRKPSHD